MPYKLEQVSPRRWSVKNSETGTIHSKHTTKAKAEAQLRLLNSIQSLTGKGLIQDKYIESLENPSDKYPPKVPLPMIDNFEIDVPPYIIKPIERKGKQKGSVITSGYKLVKTLTKTRNLSTREGGFPSIQLIPQTHEVDATVHTWRNNKAIPTIDDFSKKDQAIIKKLFLNPNDDLYLKNKQRGFPEVMAKNIQRHRQLGTSQLSNDFVIPPPKKRGRPKKTAPATTIDAPASTPRPNIPISFETSVPSNYEIGAPQAPSKKEKGRPKKYNDDTQRKSIKLQQQRESSKRIYLDSLTPTHKEKYLKKQEKKALKGTGIFSDIKNTFVNFGNKTSELYNKVVHHDTAYPPNLTAIKNEMGEEIITSLQIGRTPVPSAISTAMNTVSLGGFDKVFKTLPFDKLFHLFLIITTDKGKFLLEKNERINVSKSIPSNDLEIRDVVIPNNLSVNTLIDDTQKYMGGNFLPYDPATQNCQDFVLSLLKANNILTDELNRFVKQDTSEIFKQNPNLAKISRKLTDIGAAINVVQQGGSLRKLKSNGNNISMDRSFFHQLPQAETQIRSSLGVPIMRGSGFFDDIGNTFRSLPQKAQETFQPIAEQSHIPTNLSDLSNIAHIAQIPTDIGGVKRYGKIGLTYGLPALGSALGGAAGSAATLNPLGAIAGATLGGVAGRLAAEQANKQIGDGIGRRRRRGRPSTGGALNSTHMRAGMCGGSVTLDMNGKLIRRFDNFNLKPSMSSTKGNINAVMQPMNGSGWFDKALDTSFTPRQAIQLAKNVPGLAKEAGRDIEGAGVKAKRFVKGSAEAKAHMAKIRGMKK